MTPGLLPRFVGLVRTRWAGAGVSAQKPRRNAASPFGLAFDSSNPEAIRWAQTRAAELVTGVSADAQAAMRHIIERAFTEHLTPDQTAHLLKACIGLTDRQADALANFRAELTNPKNFGNLIYSGNMPNRIPEDGFDDEVLQERIDRYSESLLNERAEMIARTELVAASNEGQRQLWLQASDEGLLDKGAQKRQWITTPDERTCEICGPMDGQVVGLEEEFLLPTNEKVLGPPAHPQCRCAMRLSFAGTEEGEILGELFGASARTAGGPGSGWFREKGHVPGSQSGGGSSSGRRPVVLPEKESEFNKEVQKLFKELPIEQREVLSYYSGKGYQHINEALRRGVGEGEPLTRDMVDNLDKSFKFEAEKDLMVYRGAKSLDAKVGQVYKDKAFLSTSLSPFVAEEFTEHYGPGRGETWKIVVPKGTPLAFPCCKALGEKEVLLPRGGHLKVLSRDGNEVHAVWSPGK